MRRRWNTRLLTTVLAGLLLAVGCSEAPADSPTATVGGVDDATPGLASTATVSAEPAASMTAESPSEPQSGSGSGSGSGSESGGVGGAQGPATPDAVTSPPAVATPPPFSTDPADYRIPENIDPAYVSRILDVLSEIEASAAREAVSTTRLTPDFFALLTSVYTGFAYGTEIAPYWETMDAEGYAALAEVPGAAVNTDAVVVALEPCLQVAVTRDYSALTRDPSEPRRVLVALVEKTGTANDVINPTPYLINYEQQPGRRDPCLQQPPPPPPPGEPPPPGPPPPG